MLGPFEKLSFGQVLEPRVLRHRQVRTIDLQDEPCVDDSLVLLAHCGCERLHVCLVGRVVLVGLKRRHDARGSGVHEQIVGRVLLRGGSQVAQVGRKRFPLDHFDRPDAGFAFEALFAGEDGHAGAEFGETFQVEGDLALVVAAEAREPVFDVRGVADLARLAVAHHIDAGRNLSLHVGVDGFPHRAIEIRAVERLAALLTHEHLDHGRAAGEAADVCGEDAVSAELHRTLPTVAAGGGCASDTGTSSSLSRPNRT